MIFRLKLRYRLLLIVFLLLWGLLMPLGNWHHPLDVRLWGGGDWLIFPLQLLNALIWLYFGVAWSSYRLVLGENSLMGHFPAFPLNTPSVYRYEDILQVERGRLRGHLRLRLKGGKVRTLQADLLEGGPERLLAALERHLPPGRIAPGVALQLKQFRPLEGLNLLVSGILVFYFSVTLLFFLYNSKLIQNFNAWQTDLRLPKSTPGAFAFDGEGQPWVAVDVPLSNRQALARLTPGSLGYLPLPASREYYSPIGPAYDASGQPWLVSERERAVLHWNGDEWERLPLPGEGDFFIVDAQSGAVAGKGDLISQKGPGLWEVDWSQGTLQPLPLPAEAAGMLTRHVHVLPDHSFLAAFASQAENEFILYHFRQGAWQETAYPLEPPSADGIVRDFTLDAQGTLWALGYNRPDSERNAFYLGQYEASTGHWDWRPLPHSCGETEYLFALEVDARGRAWVQRWDRSGSSCSSTKYSASRFVSAYQFTGDHSVQEVVSYTEENSGLQASQWLRLGTDGRLWSGVTWIDTRPSDLAPPLPGWLAILLKTPWFILAYCAFLCTVLPFGLVFLWLQGDLGF